MTLKDRDDNLKKAEQTTRRGVTLVEMLVVITIIAILATLTIGGFVVLPERARARGTEALVGKLNGAMLEEIKRFQRGSQDITAQPVDVALSGGNPNRARVIATMREMRQQFPDVFIVDAGNSSDTFDNDGDGEIDEADEAVIGPWNLLDVDNDGIPDQAAGGLPAQAVAYREYMSRHFSTPVNGIAFADAHKPWTARAECLYMILAGVKDASLGNAAVQMNSDEVADTDGDGLLEIVDKWGNPVQFFLWPSYYSSPMQQPGRQVDAQDRFQLLTETIDPGNPPAIPYWWYAQGVNPGQRFQFERLYKTLSNNDPNIGASSPKGFNTVPLIVSAGGDQGFGLHSVLEAGSYDYFGGTLTVPSNPEGLDGIVGTEDDELPIGLMLSPGADGEVGPTDGADEEPLISTGLPIPIPHATVEGYEMNLDNIDNHNLRAN